MNQNRTFQVDHFFLQKYTAPLSRDLYFNEKKYNLLLSSNTRIWIF